MARAAASTAKKGEATGRRPSGARRAAPAPRTAGRGHVLIISGLSGSGKSQASKLLEDRGYYCVDNLPPELLDELLELRRSDPRRYRRLALVLDIRGGDPAPAIQRATEQLTGEGVPLRVIFLEADVASLVSRFSETRHRHPLQGHRASVQDGIGEERRRLGPTRRMAHHVLDTSRLSIGQLKVQLLGLLPDHAPGTVPLRIDVLTFGFKYGVPLEVDLLFDVRFLTNPYWEPDLKPLSGLHEPVRDYVLRQPAAGRFLELVIELLQLTAPAYRAEGKEQLRIALGCTGGYHRSIVLAEELGRRLGTVADTTVTVNHRELGR